MTDLESSSVRQPDQLAADRIPSSTRRLRRAGIIVIAIAVALLDWVVCAKIIGVDLIVNQGTGDQPVSPVLVALAPILAGLSGWLLLAILERFVKSRAALVWRIIAGAVLLLSLYSPLTMAQSAATAVCLVSMHLLVGAVLIIGLPRRQR